MRSDDSPMSILDDRGGGWRSISSANNVGHCRESTARKGWEPLD